MSPFAIGGLLNRVLSPLCCHILPSQLAVFHSCRAIFWSSWSDKGVRSMVIVELDEGFSNTGDGFTGVVGLKNKNSGLFWIELRSF